MRVCVRPKSTTLKWNSYYTVPRCPPLKRRSVCPSTAFLRPVAVWRRRCRTVSSQPTTDDDTHGGATSGGGGCSNPLRRLFPSDHARIFRSEVVPSYRPAFKPSRHDSPVRHWRAERRTCRNVSLHLSECFPYYVYNIYNRKSTQIIH
jgi:hypothetical protein